MPYQQKLLCSYVRQKNISILMIVIKRLWASVFYNIIVEENLKKQISFVIFLLKSTQKVIYVYTIHYTEPPGKQKFTEP